MAQFMERGGATKNSFCVFVADPIPSFTEIPNYKHPFVPDTSYETSLPKFFIRLDWPLFRPAAALNPEP